MKKLFDIIQDDMEDIRKRDDLDFAEKLDLTSKLFEDASSGVIEYAEHIIADEYMGNEDTMVYGLFLCGALRLKKTGRLVQWIVGRERSVGEVIAGLWSLGKMKYKDSYDYIKNKYTSKNFSGDYTHQALISLAEIDYKRTVPLLLNYLKEKKDETKETLSCVFINRFEEVGNKFLEEFNELKKGLEQDYLEILSEAFSEAKRFVQNNSKPRFRINFKPNK